MNAISKPSNGAYNIIDHTYDVLVVGAGGAGLRATLGMGAAGLKTACITKVFPTRSHTVAAQGGIGAALGNMGEDDWRWHMYDTVKGSDWLGDQDSIEYMCREAVPAIYELEHFGVPFSRTEDGRIYQRPFGGHMQEYGKTPANRACAAADRTGACHPSHAVSAVAEARSRIFRRVLRARPDHGRGKARAAASPPGASRMAASTASVPRRRCWRPAAMAAHTFRARLPTLALATAAAWLCGPACLRQDMEFVQFHPTGIFPAGCLITEGVRGEGGYLTNGNGERFMERYAPTAKDLASRDVVSRSMTIEINEGRGVGPNKDHIHLHIEHLGADLLNERLPGISETAKVFAGVDVTKDPIPVLPTVHYNMGGIPTNYRTEVLRPTAADPDAVVPGLMAVGEAACVSVHGANRLGTNSLLDLVVFGRAAAHRAQEILKPGASQAPLPARAGENGLDRLDRKRHNPGTTKTGEVREQMQRAMQAHAAVFRTSDSLKQGVSKMRGIWDAQSNIGVTDRSMIWNSDLAEALELDNLVANADDDDGQCREPA